jgi:hypothetical protein
MSLESRYLTGQYAEENPTFHVEDSAWKAGHIGTMVEKHGVQPQTVCEVGCGAGEILRQLQLRWPQVDHLYGYEFSPQGYALCLQRQNERLTYFNDDLFTSQQHADLMLCIDVFEHIPDYLTFLQRLRAHGDHFIFHIPLDMNVQMVLRSAPQLYVREQVGHLHYFSKDTALATLRDGGYEIVDWVYTPNGIDRPKRTLAKLAKLPRQLFARISQEYTARVLGGYSLLVYARPV